MARPGGLALADTATVFAGGPARLSAQMICTSDGVCALDIDEDGWLECQTGAIPDVIIQIVGVPGRFIHDGVETMVGVEGATIRVPYEAIARGQPLWIPDQSSGTLHIGTMTVAFAETVYDCEGNPILPAEVALTNQLPSPDACSQNALLSGEGCLAESVRVLRQNDAPVTEGYLMVSKVRPDWLLPTRNRSFESGYAGKTAFDGLG